MAVGQTNALHQRAASFQIISNSCSYSNLHLRPTHISSSSSSVFHVKLLSLSCTGAGLQHHIKCIPQGNRAAQRQTTEASLESENWKILCTRKGPLFSPFRLVKLLFDNAMESCNILTKIQIDNKSVIPLGDST